MITRKSEFCFLFLSYEVSTNRQMFFTPGIWIYSRVASFYPILFCHWEVYASLIRITSHQMNFLNQSIVPKRSIVQPVKHAITMHTARSAKADLKQLCYGDTCVCKVSQELLQITKTIWNGALPGSVLSDGSPIVLSSMPKRWLAVMGPLDVQLGRWPVDCIL